MHKIVFVFLFVFLFFFLFHFGVEKIANSKSGKKFTSDIGQKKRFHKLSTIFSSTELKSNEIARKYIFPFVIIYSLY